MTEIKNEQTKDLTPSRGLIGRAKAVDRIWTVMFYLVALFFLLLLFAFAGYVIIKGFAGATPEMFRFDRNGIGNYFFNTIYLVFLSLLISVPIGVMGGNLSGCDPFTAKPSGRFDLCGHSVPPADDDNDGGCAQKPSAEL